MKYKLLQQLLGLLTCILLLLGIAIHRNNKVIGHDLRASSLTTESTERFISDGEMVISTYDLAGDIMGYGGRTPLQITIKDGVIEQIDFLPNSETPSFFDEVKNNPSIARLVGMRVSNALVTPIDVVSGATLSSNAVRENIVRGLLYAQDRELSVQKSTKELSFKTICAIVVILLGCIIPTFFKGSRYRLYQLILNVVVLGFWSGSFISYSLLINYLSNGVNLWVSIVPILLIITAFILPLFSKRGHYCGWICPFGSLQEIAGRCVKRKWAISARTITFLNYFRNVLWAVLIVIMFCGVTFNWMDYEPFSAFLFQQASPIVIIIAVVFIVLSFFITRPYCRFVCPTGTLFHMFLKNK